VPDPPTNRDTTSLSLPVWGVPFRVEDWLLDGDSGECPSGVAVVRDILVVLW
jgi:hypothetical protein